MQQRLDIDTCALLNSAEPQGEIIAGDTRWQTDPATPHWHLVGPYLRPLHEQLDALSDSAVWAGVAADSKGVRQLMGNGRSGDGDLRLTYMQRGTEYAALTVVGDIGIGAVQQLQRHARVLLEDGVRTLVIDLSGVSRCDRRLAAVLGRLQRILRARQGTLQLTRVPYELRGELTIRDLSNPLGACGAGLDLAGPSVAEIQSQSLR